MAIPHAEHGLDFAFHDIVNLRLRTTDPRVHAFYRREFAYHLNDLNGCRSDSPVISLDISRDSRVTGDYTRCMHKVLASWAQMVRITENGASISVNGNTPSIPIVRHVVVQAIMRYKAAQRGILMLHSGAISRDGQSVIFAGKSGSGKSTTTSLVLCTDERWTHQADDFVFLRPGPISLAYQTTLHLYWHSLAALPEMANRFSHWERHKLRLFSFVRKISNEKIKWPLRVPPERIWLDRAIEDVAVPAALIYLCSDTTGKPGLQPVAEPESVEDALFDMNVNEVGHFITIAKNMGLPSNEELSAWLTQERQLLSQLLKEIPVYELRFPPRNRAEFTRRYVVDAINTLVKS